MLLDVKRCVGVEFKICERTIVAHARKEVVLSTDAINSPQLLELSEIGQQEVIAAHGIPMCHELPGVGENLRVVDGSIVPTLVFGSANAACIMIGEKASNMILAAHA